LGYAYRVEILTWILDLPIPEWLPADLLLDILDLWPPALAIIELLAWAMEQGY